ncbi:MAG: 23S rRNA (pseudouridine(1915)-N(3))-methyltransferase RlmH, partial [Bacteroidales bacterium]|nr:23S rRNA (pseudouridine(1915)-N(3))-methyltransferase RlmH [Bacteroidales bacterium]
MKTVLLCIGKTDSPYLQTGIADYASRLPHYIPFEMTVIPDVKNSRGMREEQQKTAEGKQILAQVETSDT